MQVIKDKKSLTSAISQLERVRESEANLVKQHFNDTLHTLNPMTIIKEKIHDTISSPFFKNKLVQSALFIGSSLLSSKFVIGSHSGMFLKKTLDNIISSTMDTRGFPNSNPIKTFGIPILKNLLTKLKFNM